MSQENAECEFYDPGQLIDGDLELVLDETRQADPGEGRVPEYRFTMRVLGSGPTVGRVVLRLQCTERLKRYGGNLSYDVSEEYRGNRYAARGCRMVLPLAVRHGLDSLLITCRADNEASRRTCELMGATYVDTIETEREPGEFGATCRYRVDLGEREEAGTGSAPDS